MQESCGREPAPADRPRARGSLGRACSATRDPAAGAGRPRRTPGRPPGPGRPESRGDATLGPRAARSAPFPGTVLPVRSGEGGHRVRNLLPTPPTHLGQSARGRRRGTAGAGWQPRTKGFSICAGEPESRPSGSDASRDLRFRNLSPAPRRTPWWPRPGDPCRCACLDTARLRKAAAELELLAHGRRRPEVGHFRSRRGCWEL